MRAIRSLGVAVVAAVALLGAYVGSATALPTYKVCKKEVAAEKVEGKYTGHYLNKECSEHATAEQEAEGAKNKFLIAAWNEGKEAEPKFKVTTGQMIWKLYIPGIGVIGDPTCRKSTGEGHVTGPSTGTIELVMEGCDSEAGVCTSPGEIGERLKTDLGTTVLGENARGEVVLRIGKEGVQLAEFNCGAKHGQWLGTLDGVVGDGVGVIGKDSTVMFSTNAEGEQEGGLSGDLLLTEFEGQLPTGIEASASIKGEEMEIEQ